MIINNKTAFLENKLTESIGKPKDLWKALRSLGLTNKNSSCEVNALKINNKVEHDFNSVLEIITQLWRRTLSKCSLNQLINTLLTRLLNIMNI